MLAADASTGRDGLEPERPAAVDAKRLEGRAPSKERLVVGTNDRVLGIDQAATRPRQHARAQCARRQHTCGRPDRREQRTRLRPRLLDLGRRVGVPTTPPPTHRWIGRPRPRRSGSSERDRDRRSRTRGRAHPSMHRGRPARAPRSGRRRRSSARRSPSRRGTWPRGSREAGSFAQRALDGRDHVLDARELAGGHQLRPRTDPRGTRARGRSAPGRRSSRARRRPSPSRGARRPGFERTRALDRPRPDPPPRRERNSSGDAEITVQPSPANGSGCSGRSGASAAASALGSPANGAERCCTTFTW